MGSVAVAKVQLSQAQSVFYHVENFLFYVLCDAATSRRDQVLAFFSKARFTPSLRAGLTYWIQEKVSYDDFNLACIVTFPPWQSQGFGKLLMEFSECLAVGADSSSSRLGYLLTRHPSTRPETLSPGTPERPLSDLGLKGYTTYWVSVILRFCRHILGNADPLRDLTIPSAVKGTAESRHLRGSLAMPPEQVTETEEINGIGQSTFQLI